MSAQTLTAGEACAGLIVLLLTHVWMLDPGCCSAPGGHQGMKGGLLSLHHKHIASRLAVRR
jgi:hypothetical protein